MNVGANALYLLSGLAAWTFLEYVIHGWMGHRFRTFATPLHNVHHRDPSRVFTIGGWLPVAAIWFVGVMLWGFAPAMIIYSGIVLGFVLYELMHYRIHYARPRNRLETYLRERHLVHHYRTPDNCFGVTSPLWDRLLSTDLAEAEMRSLRATVAATSPLTGRTNVRMLLPFLAIH